MQAFITYYKRLSVNGNRSIDISISLETRSVEVMVKFLIMWFRGVKAEELSCLTEKLRGVKELNTSLEKVLALHCVCVCEHE